MNLEDKINEAIDSIEAKETEFDYHKYRMLNELGSLLMRCHHKIDMLTVYMAKHCLHEHQQTKIENNYKTTRCLDCYCVLNSKPLPGIPWDMD